MSVTLSQFKSHLRVTDSNEDASLQVFLSGAIGYVESETHRKLSVSETVDSFDSFGEMELTGNAPSDVVITYIDVDGASQTLSASIYAVKTHKAKPYIVKAYGEVWPSTRAEDAAVTVTYNSGYTAITLPPPLVSAVLLMAASLYEVREEFVIVATISNAPITVKRLIAPYRLYTL